MNLHEQLKKHEGIRLKPYVDSVGKLTIGVGRNLDDMGLTIGEVDMLLNNDIARVKTELYKALPFVIDMDSVRRDALVNMVFNLGISRFLKFKKTIAYLEQGEYDMAATEMLDSNWARQVGIRAIELSEQIRTGEYQ